MQIYVQILTFQNKNEKICININITIYIVPVPSSGNTPNHQNGQYRKQPA